MKTKTIKWNLVTERPGVKTSQLIAECRKLFPVWCWQKDEEFDADFPAPMEATTREFKPNVEADEEHKNKSANDLQNTGVQGITLREYLIMVLQHFKETGKHLDVENVTLCSGSRYRDGRVPIGSASDGELFVDGCHPGYAYDALRARACVSPDKVYPVKPPEVCAKCKRPLT